MFPLSNWTELDVWEYIDQEQLEVPSIYFAHEREVFKRDGMLYAWREGTELIEGEEVFAETVRYRTVGDMSCTGGVRSQAATLAEVVLEIAATISPSGARRSADDRVIGGRDGGSQEGRLLLARDAGRALSCSAADVREGPGRQPRRDRGAHRARARRARRRERRRLLRARSRRAPRRARRRGLQPRRRAGGGELPERREDPRRRQRARARRRSIPATASSPRTRRSRRRASRPASSSSARRRARSRRWARRRARAS